MKPQQASLWRLPVRSWPHLIWRVWQRLWADEILGRSGELAYFFLFAMFPLLLFLSTLLGYMAGASASLYATLFRLLAQISPSPDITALFHHTLADLTEKRNGAKLYISLLVAIWLASNGMTAVARTLNGACGLAETRSWWRVYAMAMALTVSFTLLLILGMGTLFYGVAIGEAMADQLGVGELFVAGYQTLKWPLALLTLILSFELIYNYAPDLKDRPRRWITPGGFTGVLLWLTATFGLRVYLMYFHTYTSVYGSLGAVIALLLWFYLTAFSILVGGEVNSEIFSELGAPRERRVVTGPVEEVQPPRRRKTKKRT